MKKWKDIKSGDYIYMLKWHAKNNWLEIRRCFVKNTKEFGKYIKIEFGHFLNTKDKGFDSSLLEYINLMFKCDECLNIENFEKEKPTYLLMTEFNEDIITKFENCKK